MTIYAHIYFLYNPAEQEYMRKIMKEQGFKQILTADFNRYADNTRPPSTNCPHLCSLLVSAVCLFMRVHQHHNECY